MIDFEWKGEKASEHGIIVSSLPSIVKAPKKYEKIEIDGRDGDIIIEKGFEAYDKEVKIGLARNYDLNWLMNWLDGSGKIVFSNEPDVYYEGQIINEIQFKKLLTFKTASIKFHVQPFKYLVNEQKIVQNFTSSTKKVQVQNAGLIESKPIMTLYGSGTIAISVNGEQICSITIGDDGDSATQGHMTLDSIQEEAYEDSIMNLKNRKMLGVFPTLKSGMNEISFSGNVTKVEILAKSRWF